MRILAVDTTSRIVNIALSSPNFFLSIERDVQVNNYESIVSLIESILKKSRLKIEEVDYFGACVGPGSFTGIRIGLSTMKALAYSVNRPIVGFRSLDAISYSVKDVFFGLLCIMQDARRNNIYSSVFSNYRDFRRISPYLLTDIPQLLRKLKKLNNKNKNLYFYGDAVSIYKDQIKDNFPHSIILHQKMNSLKRGRAMISLTKENLKYKCNSFNLLPFYMYPKDCQVRKTEK